MNSLIISSIISLIISVITVVTNHFIQKGLNNRGQVKLYIKRVYNKVSEKSWGFEKNNQNAMFFHIPMWLEIHNTKNKNEIVRDLDILLYKDGKFLKKMKQITHIKEDKYGDEGVYSFLVEPQTIKRFNLLFVLNKKDLNSDFDTMKIGYYNSEDKYIEYLLDKTNGNWIPYENPIDEDWKILNNI